LYLAKKREVLVKIVRVCLLTLLCALALGAPLKISPEGVDVPAPQLPEKGSSVVIDSKGTIHIVFQGYSRELRQSVVYYRQVVGSKVSESRQLTSKPAGLPSIAVTPQVLFAAWAEKGESADRKDTSGVIGFGSSTDGGRTWTTSILPGKTLGATSPKIFADSDGNPLVYGVARISELGAEQEVYIFRSADRGSSWTVTTPSASVKGVSLEPHVVQTNPGRLLIAWAQSESPAWSLRLSESDDNGKTWKETRIVNDDPRLPVEAPWIISSGQRVAVFWKQVTVGGVVLAVDSSVDGGASWADDRRLLEKEVASLEYQVVGEKDRLRVFYSSRSGSGVLLRHRLFDLELKHSDFWKTKGLVPAPRLVKESLHPMFFFATLLKTKVGVAVSHREEGRSWRVSVFFAEKLAKSPKSDGILRLAPDLGGSDRSLLYAVPLPDGVGVFYREQQARRLPMESHPGELLFERASVPK